MEAMMLVHCLFLLRIKMNCIYVSRLDKKGNVFSMETETGHI